MLLGRTDAGVHALGQVANFKTNSKISIDKIPHAINSKLPNSIVIKNAEEVDERFHARYNCTGKTYKYVIYNSNYPSALNRYREFYISQELDFDKMKKALKYFEGEHDFAGFKSSGGNAKKTTIRTIKKAVIEKATDGRITITLSRRWFFV
jgi:tRNA pseudouridine38-40 synthase